jgi:hypothetical protein
VVWCSPAACKKKSEEKNCGNSEIGILDQSLMLPEKGKTLKDISGFTLLNEGNFRCIFTT